jgi:membrane associated rhomboid family serine protease
MRNRSFSYDKNAPIWIIIIINLLVFIATLVSRNLVYILGLRADLFLEQPWTIITNLFVHAGIWHILFNMITLYFYGSFLSQLIGTGGFLLIYFFGGIVGNIFFLLLAPPQITGVGASGAIFALGGALAVLTPRLRVYVFPIPAPMPLWAAVIGGFVIMSLVPGIAWQAHLGGLIFGLVAGYFYRKKARPLFY